MRCRLDVQGYEEQGLATLFRPTIGEDESAALPFHFGDAGFAVIRITPRAGEAEPVKVEAKRGFHVFDVEPGAGEPICHRHIASEGPEACRKFTAGEVKRERARRIRS